MTVTVEERKSLWFLMPIVLLGGLLSMLAVMIGIATHDDGFAVEPDYYQKATRWDETAARQRLSDELGWSSNVALTALAPGSQLSIELLDAMRAPITGARVEVEAFHNARAADIEHAVLSEAGGGRYHTALRSTRPGLWEVRITAVGAGGERYLHTARLDLPRSSH
jgi:nitrogen fixation protein FixH